MSENSDNYIDALEAYVNSLLADKINTMLEGVIVAYHEGSPALVDVKPSGKKVYSDGDSEEYQTIFGLPVHWLVGAGGNGGFKMPVNAGDPCMIFFAQHPQEEETDSRRFSLTDAYVIPGTNTSDAIPGNRNVVMYHKNSFVAITPDGDIEISCRNLVINADTEMAVTTPLAKYSAQVEVNGLFTFKGGALGSGDSGGGAVVSFNGRLIANDATINGRDFMTHFHKNSGGSGNGGTVG